MQDVKLSVADEFSFLFQPLSVEDYKELEEKLVTENSTQEIKVWRESIIEPPERYLLCQEWGLPISEKRYQFADSLEAGAFICMEELERKDLSAEMRTFLIGRLFQYRHEIAARDFVLQGHKKNGPGRRGNKPKGMYETARELSDELNLVPGTVLKYGRYASALESIRRLEPSVAAAIIRHRVKISHEDLQDLVANEDRLKILRRISREMKESKVNYSEFKKKLDSEKKKLEQIHEKKIVREVVPSIHEMPKYDPDADILNLIYTIPSWISSIQRAMSHTDFSITTVSSNRKLSNQIDSLKNILTELEDKVKEVR